MVAVTTKVELDGNFFRRDPGKTLRHNIRDMLDALSSEMEGIVRDEIAGHAGQMPGWTGHTLSTVKGYTTSAKTGRRWGLWAAVGTVTAGMSAKDAIRTKAAAATIERRFHPFRRVKAGVYRSRAVITANLTKDLE